MAALQRALALAQVHAGAVPVGEHLHLDVAGALQVALDQDAAVAERGLGLAAGGGERVVELRRGADHAHPLAAAARQRLDDHGEAVAAGEGGDLLAGEVAAVDARHDGDARLARELLRARLVAHQLDRLRGRPDPGQPRVADGAGEAGVLAQEPVARMHGGDAEPHGRGDDLVRGEVGADLDGRVARVDVQRVAVLGREDGRRARPERVHRPGDPHRDLPPVRDQHGARHHGQAPSARAMTICWISSVPSPIVRILASR